MRGRYLAVLAAAFAVAACGEGVPQVSGKWKLQATNEANADQFREIDITQQGDHIEFVLAGNARGATWNPETRGFHMGAIIWKEAGRDEGTPGSGGAAVDDEGVLLVRLWDTAQPRLFGGCLALFGPCPYVPPPVAISARYVQP